MFFLQYGSTLATHSYRKRIALSELSQSLEVSYPTVRSYLGILKVRQIQHLAGKAFHEFLNTANFECLPEHPVLGAIWEWQVVKGYVVVFNVAYRNKNLAGFKILRG